MTKTERELHLYVFHHDKAILFLHFLQKRGAQVVVGDIQPSKDPEVHNVECDVTNYDQMQVFRLVSCHDDHIRNIKITKFDIID